MMIETNGNNLFLPSVCHCEADGEIILHAVSLGLGSLPSILQNYVWCPRNSPGILLNRLSQSFSNIVLRPHHPIQDAASYIIFHPCLYALACGTTQLCQYRDVYTCLETLNNVEACQLQLVTYLFLGH